MRSRSKPGPAIPCSGITFPSRGKRRPPPSGRVAAFPIRLLAQPTPGSLESGGDEGKQAGLLTSRSSASPPSRRLPQGSQPVVSRGFCRSLQRRNRAGFSPASRFSFGLGAQGTCLPDATTNSGCHQRPAPCVGLPRSQVKHGSRRFPGRKYNHGSGADASAETGLFRRVPGSSQPLGNQPDNRRLLAKGRA
jgi:hypothetical protein